MRQHRGGAHPRCMDSHPPPHSSKPSGCKAPPRPRNTDRIGIGHRHRVGLSTEATASQDDKRTGTQRSCCIRAQRKQRRHKEFHKEPELRNRGHQHCRVHHNRPHTAEATTAAANNQQPRREPKSSTGSYISGPTRTDYCRAATRRTAGRGATRTAGVCATAPGAVAQICATAPPQHKTIHN